MADNKVYVLDDGANKYEAMTREQITAAIIEAVNEGTISDIDAGFITKVLEKNKQKVMSFWVGTQAEFHALESKDPDTLYLFSDDPLISDINNAINAEETNRKAADGILEAKLETLDSKITKIEDGTTEVKKATETKVVNIINSNDLTGVTSWLTTNGAQVFLPGGVTITIPSSFIPTDGSYVYLNVSYDVSVKIYDNDYSFHFNLPLSVSSYRGNTQVQFINAPLITKATFSQVFFQTSPASCGILYFELEITNARISGNNLTFTLTPTSNSCARNVVADSGLYHSISSSTLQTPRVTILKKS